jgi:hypothetical protein
VRTRCPLMTVVSPAAASTSDTHARVTPPPAGRRRRGVCGAAARGGRPGVLVVVSHTLAPTWQPHSR